VRGLRKTHGRKTADRGYPNNRERLTPPQQGHDMSCPYESGGRGTLALRLQNFNFQFLNVGVANGEGADGFLCAEDGREDEVGGVGVVR